MRTLGDQPYADSVKIQLWRFCDAIRSIHCSLLLWRAQLRDITSAGRSWRQHLMLNFESQRRLNSTFQRQNAARDLSDLPMLCPRIQQTCKIATATYGVNLRPADHIKNSGETSGGNCICCNFRLKFTLSPWH